MLSYLRTSRSSFPADAVNRAAELSATDVIVMTWENINQGVAFLGSILVIIAFFWQFGPKLLEILRPRDSSITPSPNVILKGLLTAIAKLFERKFVAGVSLSLLAAILWGLSYTSYRTAAVVPLNPIEVGIPVFIIGGLTIFLFSVIARLYGRPLRTAPDVLRPLFTGNGMLIIFGNVLELVCFIGALHYITAGQTITLYKTNPVWVLLLLYLINRQRAAHASIAAVFCVFMGVFVIMAPEFTYPLNLTNVSGSIIAVLGGFFFSIYSVSVFNYPLYTDNSTLSERLLAQAAVFLLSAIVLGLAALATKTFPLYTSYSLLILTLNGLRIGVVYICYTEALKLIHPVLVASLVALEVPLTMVMEYYWLGDRAAWPLIVGSFIILVAILSIIKENEVFIKRIKQAR